MIRILFFIIIAAIALSVAYIRTRKDSNKKIMLLIGAGTLAAAIGILMQTTFPLYLSLLGVIGISLVATLVYMKGLEREEQRKVQMMEERKARKESAKKRPAEPAKKPIHEPQVIKPVGMQTIAAVREEQKVGQ